MAFPVSSRGCGYAPARRRPTAQLGPPALPPPPLFARLKPPTRSPLRSLSWCFPQRHRSKSAAAAAATTPVALRSAGACHESRSGTYGSAPPIQPRGAAAGSRSPDGCWRLVLELTRHPSRGPMVHGIPHLPLLYPPRRHAPVIAPLRHRGLLHRAHHSRPLPNGNWWPLRLLSSSWDRNPQAQAQP